MATLASGGEREQCQFIDAHAMAPVAEKQEDKHKDSVFDSVRARLPGQGSSYERAWKEPRAS